MEIYNSPIPIRNLFYILCYAWDILDIVDDIPIEEDCYDNAYNLLSRVFSYGVKRLIRSGFHRSYLEEHGDLSTIRGKILIGESIKTNSQFRNELICSYDEYSENNTFNQILKYTLDVLIVQDWLDSKILSELKNERFYFSGIDSIAPTRENCKKLHFNRFNDIYRLLIQISVMIYDNISPDEQNGKKVFKDFFRQERMESVFEKFILNFYKKKLSSHIYKVHAPYITWPIEHENDIIWEENFVIGGIPTNRRTDIVIENQKEELQMIFDAKYYEKTFVTAYMNSEDERVRTSHLNQVRGYLLDSRFKGDKIGALLYPTTTNDLRQGIIFRIKRTPIIVKTLNLNNNWYDIEQDMLSFVDRIESSYLKIRGHNTL